MQNFKLGNPEEVRQVFVAFQRHLYSQSEHASVADTVCPQALGEVSSHLTEVACEYTHQALSALDKHIALSQPMFWDTQQVVAKI